MTGQGSYLLLSIIMSTSGALRPLFFSDSWFRPLTVRFETTTALVFVVSMVVVVVATHNQNWSCSTRTTLVIGRNSAICKISMLQNRWERPRIIFWWREWTTRDRDEWRIRSSSSSSSFCCCCCCELIPMCCTLKLRCTHLLSYVRNNRPFRFQ